MARLTTAVGTVSGAATNAAIKSDGTGVKSTVTVSNAMIGENILRFRLTKTEAGDASNIVLFSGAEIPVASQTLPTNVALSESPFASYTAMQQYFNKISTQISRINMLTNDTDNFINQLIMSEMDPTGETKTVKTDLRKFRVDNGTGFRESIEFNFPCTVWSGLTLKLKTLKSGSYIDFEIYVSGWDKSRNLQNVEAQRID